MPTCRELIDFLADYREGLLGPTERASFDRHLARCPDCVAYLESYERTAALARLAAGSPDAEPPGDVPAELVAAVLSARRG